MDNENDMKIIRKWGNKHISGIQFYESGGEARTLITLKDGRCIYIHDTTIRVTLPKPKEEPTMFTPEEEKFINSIPQL
jgi:hypothetical protein